MSKSPSLRVRLIGLGYLVAWRLTRIAPERWAAAAFRSAARRSYRKNEKRRAIVAANLRPVVGDGPELDRVVREAFESYARYWLEAFRLQDLSDEEVARRIVRFDNEDLLDRVHAEGGAVLAVPHIGNWDGPGRYVARRWNLAAVVEVLRPESLFRRFVAFREALGMVIIPRRRGDDVTARCVELARGGAFVALVSDRDLSGRGIEVTMFGRKTRLPPGPAVVALRAHVPLIVGATLQTADGGWIARAYEPIATGHEPETPEEIARIMQRLADQFEALIRERPEQWRAFVPYWTD